MSRKPGDGGAARALSSNETAAVVQSQLACTARRLPAATRCPDPPRSGGATGARTTRTCRCLFGGASSGTPSMLGPRSQRRSPTQAWRSPMAERPSFRGSFDVTRQRGRLRHRRPASHCSDPPQPVGASCRVGGLDLGLRERPTGGEAVASYSRPAAGAQSHPDDPTLTRLLARLGDATALDRLRARTRDRDCPRKPGGGRGGVRRIGTARLRRRVPGARRPHRARPGPHRRARRVGSGRHGHRGREARRRLPAASPAGPARGRGPSC